MAYNQIDCKAGTTAKGQNLLANISTSRTSLLQGQYLRGPAPKKRPMISGSKIESKSKIVISEPFFAGAYFRPDFAAIGRKSLWLDTFGLKRN